MTATVRLRTTARVILVGTVENMTEHQFELVRVAVEDRYGCIEYDPYRMRLSKVQIVSIVVSAITDGTNLMIAPDELLAAFKLAQDTGIDIEAKVTALSPADFAKELCEMGVAA